MVSRILLSATVFAYAAGTVCMAGAGCKKPENRSAFIDAKRVAVSTAKAEYRCDKRVDVAGRHPDMDEPAGICQNCQRQQRAEKEKAF